MGTTTTNRSYRKPSSTDPAANLTSYWDNLADDVDADVQAVVTARPRSIVGTASVSFTTNTSFTQVVNVGSTLPSAITHVTLNIASSSGTVNGWNLRAITFTTTGFTIVGTGPSAAWSGVSVTYEAKYPA